MNPTQLPQKDLFSQLGGIPRRQQTILQQAKQSASAISRNAKRPIAPMQFQTNQIKFGDSLSFISTLKNNSQIRALQNDSQTSARSSTRNTTTVGTQSCKKIENIFQVSSFSNSELLNYDEEFVLDLQESYHSRHRIAAIQQFKKIIKPDHRQNLQRFGELMNSGNIKEAYRFLRQIRQKLQTDPEYQRYLLISRIQAIVRYHRHNLVEDSEEEQENKVLFSKIVIARKIAKQIKLKWNHLYRAAMQQVNKYGAESQYLVKFFALLRRKEQY